MDEIVIGNNELGQFITNVKKEAGINMDNVKTQKEKLINKLNQDRFYKFYMNKKSGGTAIDNLFNNKK